MMLEPFLIKAGLGGIGVVMALGPLGAFVSWRKMAYFGDSLAHAALLGVALSLVAGANLTLSVMLVCMIMAYGLAKTHQGAKLSIDSYLGVVAHGSLALGITLVSVTGFDNIDLMTYLIGDILTLSWTEVTSIYLLTLVVIVVMAVFWNQLLLTTIHEELAEVEGISPQAMQLVLNMLLAITIALSMRVVGVLLISSLLIIPAATARRLASSPEGMVVYACGFGIASVLGGVWLSTLVDVPTGPAVVVVALAFFILSHIAGRTK